MEKKIMQEIAMTILDMIQNSLRAQALQIHLWIKDSIKDNMIHIEICDNGCGMSLETLQQVTNPFFYDTYHTFYWFRYSFV